MERREFLGKTAAVAAAAVSAAVGVTEAMPPACPENVDGAVAYLLAVQRENPNAQLPSVVAGIRQVLGVIHAMKAGGAGYGEMTRVLTKSLMIVNEEHRLHELGIKME